MLDAGIFDAVSDDKITLWKSGIVLERGSLKNPICIVANYLFDTLYHDIFQVDPAGVLYEGLVSVGSKNATEPDPLDPAIIERLDNHYKYVPVDPSYYSNEGGDEPHFRRMLKWYQDYFTGSTSGGSILVPIGALRALRKLLAFANGRAIVISGDKGNSNPEQFAGMTEPHIAVHGSFSLMVNYHAVGAWITSQGGFSLHSPQEDASLKVSCFVLMRSDADMQDSQSADDSTFMKDGLETRDSNRMRRFPYLRQAFEDHVDSFGPNDFFVLQKSLKENMPNISLRTIVALLKLSDWDPDVFFKFRDQILNQAPTCMLKLRNDMSRGVPRVWTNYYMMDMEKDIAFEIGRFYYGIRELEMALKYYVISSDTVGVHHVTEHNKGLCYHSLGKLEMALQHFQKAVQLFPAYEKAHSWLERTRRDIAMLAPPVPSVGRDAAELEEMNAPAAPEPEPVPAPEHQQ